MAAIDDLNAALATLTTAVTNLVQRYNDLKAAQANAVDPAAVAAATSTAASLADQANAAQ